MTKNNEVIAEKPFQNCGVTRRLALAVLNLRSSSIYPSYYYCYHSLIIIIHFLFCRSRRRMVV